MKTRTLLLLSVAVGLAILLAGGVFFLQLANQSTAVEPADIGDGGRRSATSRSPSSQRRQRPTVFAVDVEIGGVDDSDGIDSFGRHR